MPELGGRVGFWRRCHKRLQGKVLREYYRREAAPPRYPAASNLRSSPPFVSECDSLRRDEETSRVSSVLSGTYCR